MEVTAIAPADHRAVETGLGSAGVVPSYDLVNTMTTLRGTAAQWPSLLAQVSDILGLDSDESLFNLLKLIESELTLKPEHRKPEHFGPEHRGPRHRTPEHFGPGHREPDRPWPNAEDLRRALAAE